MCLKLLKGKHESARSHVTLYLILAFQYRPIIEEFDIQNGLNHFVDNVRILIYGFINRCNDKNGVLQKSAHYLRCTTSTSLVHLMGVRIQYFGLVLQGNCITYHESR